MGGRDALSSLCASLSRESRPAGLKIAFTAVQYVSGNGLVSSTLKFRPPIIIQLNKTAGCGGPLPARRFPGVRGGAAYIFWHAHRPPSAQMKHPPCPALIPLL